MLRGLPPSTFTTWIADAPAEALPSNRRNTWSSASRITSSAGDTGSGNEDVLWTTGVGTEQLNGAYMTPGTFEFLGVAAQVGRGLTPEDAKPGAPPVFAMSYKMWQRRFSLDPAILGRIFVLNGTPTTLVGIMPKRFTKRGADIWRPAELDRADTERWFIYQGGLKPGVTLKQVEAGLLPIAQRLAKDHPKDYPKRFSIEASSYVDSIVGPFRKTLLTLGAAVALLLMIACANGANMLLARRNCGRLRLRQRRHEGAGGPHPGRRHSVRGTARSGPAGAGIQPGTGDLYRAALRTGAGTATGAPEYRRQIGRAHV